MNGKGQRNVHPSIVAGVLRAQRQREAATRRARRRSLLASATVLLVSFVIAGLVLALLAPVALAGWAYQTYGQDVEAGLKTLENLEQRETFETSYIYDRHGTLLLEFWGEGRRIKVPLSDIPSDVVNATIATEDKTFWDNTGVDFAAIVRAVYQNYSGGSIRSGASTITQQLVRHIVFDYEERISQDYDRKIKEVALAYLLNRIRSKPEILELYLNEIYYGNLAYGIEAAAQTYFDKSARDLSLAEASLLAGLPQAPRELDPLDPSRADEVKQRQRYVLDRMVEQGFVSSAEADRAYRQDLPFKQQSVSLRAPHFVNYVRQELVTRFGAERVARGGLHITTTLDLSLQEAAQAIVVRHVDAISQTKNLTNASVVALRPDTGEIVAMVGSYNFWKKEIDGQVNVALADRQPGSSIKPLVYAAAMERGLTPGYFIWDQPVTFIIPGTDPYKPVNYDGKFHGHVSLRTALANSYNIPAVRVLRYVGVGPFIDFAHRMGITGLNRGLDWYGLSLALGGGEVKLIDLATAYGTVANQGQLVRPTPFLKIVDTDGSVLYDLERKDRPQRQQVLDPRVAFLLTTVMTDSQARTPAFGANTPLNVSRPMAVKTGTTNDWKDNWTVGFTPYLVVGVWAGNADNSSMRNSTGVTGAAPIWHDVVETVFSDTLLLKDFYPAGDPPLDFLVPPPGVVRTKACVPTSKGGCRQVEDWFYADAIPGKDPLAERLKSVQYETYQVLNLDEEGNTFCLPKPEQAIPPEALVELKMPLISSATDDDVKAFLELISNAAKLQERNTAVTESQPNADQGPPACSDEQVATALAGLALLEATPDAETASTEQVAGLSYYISSPAPGQLINGTVPIYGSAVFGGEFDYYKVEIAGPDGNWLTINSGHNNTVANGVLETLQAGGLPPGDYLLRLVVVRKDGNFPGPYVVPIKIGPAGP
jgi:peptidoglycan glycosyltransferase